AQRYTSQSIQRRESQTGQRHASRHSFCLTDRTPTDIYTLSLHDALPISHAARAVEQGIQEDHRDGDARSARCRAGAYRAAPRQGRTAMKLVFKNLFRHRLRTVLTMLGIATAVMAFGLIRTIVGAWNAGVAGSAENRMITRHSVSFIFPLPAPYRQQIVRSPGATAVSWANWFGGAYG